MGFQGVKPTSLWLLYKMICTKPKRNQNVEGPWCFYTQERPSGQGEFGIDYLWLSEAWEAVPIAWFGKGATGPSGGMSWGPGLPGERGCQQAVSHPLRDAASRQGFLNRIHTVKILPRMANPFRQTGGWNGHSAHQGRGSHKLGKLRQPGT